MARFITMIGPSGYTHHINIDHIVELYADSHQTVVLLSTGKTLETKEPLESLYEQFQETHR